MCCLCPAWRFDEYVDLLANKSREVCWAERVDDLEDPCVYPLRGVPCERLLRQHIWFETDEGECNRYGRVAPQAGDCGAVGVDAPGIGFVNVDADVQRIDRPHGHERIGQHARLRIRTVGGEESLT